MNRACIQLTTYDGSPAPLALFETALENVGCSLELRQFLSQLFLFALLAYVTVSCMVVV